MLKDSPPLKKKTKQSVDANILTEDTYHLMQIQKAWFV